MVTSPAFGSSEMRAPLAEQVLGSVVVASFEHHGLDGSHEAVLAVLLSPGSYG